MDRYGFASTFLKDEDESMLESSVLPHAPGQSKDEASAFVQHCCRFKRLVPCLDST